MSQTISTDTTGGADRWKGKKERKEKEGNWAKKREQSDKVKWGKTAKPTVCIQQTIFSQVCVWNRRERVGVNLLLNSRCTTHTNTHAKCNKRAERSEDNPLCITSVLLLTNAACVCMYSLCAWLGVCLWQLCVIPVTNTAVNLKALAVPRQEARGTGAQQT